MSTRARVLAALAVLGVTDFFRLAAHEYLHCWIAWHRGWTGECAVTFYRLAATAHTDPVYAAWEHPLILAATLGLPLLVALWLLAPVLSNVSPVNRLARARASAVSLLRRVPKLRP